MSRLQNAITEIIKTRPGIRPGELAKVTGRDRNQVRRAALGLAEQGIVDARQDDQGFSFYPVGNAVPVALTSKINPPEPDRNQAVDCKFRDVTEPSASRSLDVSGQPYDSRTAGALAAINKARRRQGGMLLPTQYATSLNALFELDPSGARTMAAMELAEITAAREALAREREAASRTALARAREPTMGELWAAFGRSAIKVFDTAMTDARERARARYDAETKQPAASNTEDRYRRQREQREAERAESASIREAERLAKQGPDSAKAREAARADPIRALLARAKARRELAERTASASKPPATKTWREWLTARLATPKKAVLR